MSLTAPAPDSRRLSSSDTLAPVYAKYVVMGISGVVAQGFAKLQQTTETVFSEYVTHHLEKADVDDPSAIVSYHQAGEAVNLGRLPGGGSETTVPFTGGGNSSLTANTVIVIIGVVVAVLLAIGVAVGYKVFYAPSGSKAREETRQQASGPSEEEEPPNNAQREDLVINLEEESALATQPASQPAPDYNADQAGLPPIFQHDEPGVQRHRNAIDSAALERDITSRFQALEAEQPSTVRHQGSDMMSI